MWTIILEILLFVAVGAGSSVMSIMLYSDYRNQKENERLNEFIESYNDTIDRYKDILRMERDIASGLRKSLGQVETLQAEYIQSTDSLYIPEGFIAEKLSRELADKLLDGGYIRFIVADDEYPLGGRTRAILEVVRRGESS